MAFTTGNDINILQGSDSLNVGAGAGNDRYVLTAATLTANQRITISDTLGTNTLQLAGGLVITSSAATGNSLQLTLNNGAVITVLGADTFSFQTGGDALTGTGGTTQAFGAFLTASLGYASVPTGTTPVTGGTKTVNAAGGTGGEVVVTPPVTTQNATLTVNQDTASSAAFDAPIFTSTQTGNQIQTLTTVDRLTGTAATTDVLTAILNNTEAAGTKPTMSGVEIVNLTAIGASIFDAANVVGVTRIASVDSAANLTVRNLASGAETAVTSAAPAVSSLFQFANTVVAGTADAVTLNLNNVGRGTTAANAAVINLRGETAGGFEIINVVSTGGTSRFNDLTSDSAAAIGAAGVAATTTLKTVNVAGSANLRIDNALVNVTTLDATSFTGNLRVSLDAAKDVAVTGGTGNDTLIFAAGLTTSDTVNGGGGRDAIVVTTNAAITDGNKITNVEILNVANGAAAATYDLSKVASLDAIVNASANATTFSNFSKAGAADATKGINQSGTGAVTVGVKDAGGLGSNSDTLQITVGAATQTATYVAGAVTTSAIETLKVAVADAGAFTATAAGAFLNADASVNSVVFTGGSAGIAFVSGAVAGSGVSLTNIDGSAFIGNLTATGNLFSQVIRGGSGDDTLSTGGRAAFTLGTVSDSLAGGAGKDGFVFAANTGALTDASLTGANVTALDAPAAVAASARNEITTITDLNLGGANTATRVDTIDFGTPGAGLLIGDINAGGIQVVNGGAATALTGLDLGAALNAAVANTGILGSATATTSLVAGNAANFAKAGLFTWAGDTYLVASSNATLANTFGAVAGEDIIIKVTGVTGTLDVSDFI